MNGFIRSLAMISTMSAFSVPAFADNEPGPQATDPLQAVLDRIYAHAQGEAWKKGGLRDEPLEAWLEKLVAAAGKQQPARKLPVRLRDVQPIELQPKSEVIGALIVGKHLDLPDVRLVNSVVLADGNALLYQVEGCIVIARGVLQVRQSKRCLLAAGCYANVTAYDGSPGPRTRTDESSVIVSRGWVKLGAGHGTLAAAHEGVTITRPAQQGGLFATRGSTIIKASDLPLERLPQHSLRSKLKVEGLLRPDGEWVNSFPESSDGPRRPFPLGVVLRLGEGRYVAELNRPILAQAGKPVDALRGWEVRFADENLAIFSSDTTEVPIRLEEPAGRILP